MSQNSAHVWAAFRHLLALSHTQVALQGVSDGPYQQFNSMDNWAMALLSLLMKMWPVDA